MVSPEERLEVETPRGVVSAVWADPTGAKVALAVAHGAGGGMDSPFLVGFTRAMNELDVATLRFNFAYMEQGRRSPDPAPTLQATWSAVFDVAAARAGGRPVFAGGKSLGGRIASMAVAEGMAAAGLVFLGYPLHPPGKPERIRDEHLYRIEVPMLFLEGTRDPFASWELLEGVLGKLGDRGELFRVDGGDHSFKVRGGERDPRAIGASLAEPAAAFIHRVARKS